MMDVRTFQAQDIILQDEDVAGVELQPRSDRVIIYVHVNGMTALRVSVPKWAFTLEDAR